MNEKEAIKYLPSPSMLTNDTGGVENMFNKEQIAYNMAIVALEKQIPKKPKFACGFEYESSKIGFKVCPNCSKRFEAQMVTKYCENCGQRLDWSD